jgi:hypothetical protein
MQHPIFPTTNWKKRETNIFWDEIVPCHHVLQIYENDELFLDALATFVEGGFNSADSCIIIATRSHLNQLHSELGKRGFDIEFLVSQNLYIPLEAEETLSKFMINDWPDEELFMKTVHQLFEKAGYNNRRIRAFGEMVALLWARGLNESTVHLEYLWNKLSAHYSFCLFCAYPKSAFTDGSHGSVLEICQAHSKLIAESEKKSTEIIFQDIIKKKALN